MSAIIPNVGEQEMLRAVFGSMAPQLFLYKGASPPAINDGTVYSNLSEMPTGGGRGYTPIELAPVVVDDALAASKWFINTNSLGKGQAQYNDVALQWIMAAQEVTDANTVQGIGAFVWKVPFTSGAVEIKVGDIIKGNAGAIATVTHVMVQTGTWAGGNAAGYLYIKARNATAFVNGEVITRQGAVATVSIVDGGTGYAVGDIIQITQAGGSGVKLVVTAVNAGVVTGVVVVEGGMGYAAAAGLPTTHLTGAGDNALTITIASLAATTYALSATGTGNAGDALKILLWAENMTTPAAVTAVGQKFTATPIYTAATS